MYISPFASSLFGGDEDAEKWGPRSSRNRRRSVSRCSRQEAE
jgi:hypothetical protein